MEDYLDKLEDQYANYAIDFFFKQMKDMAEAAAKLQEQLEPFIPKK